MNCCPEADFEFLPNGMNTHSRNIQADGFTKQFFPFRMITNVSYTYTRTEGGSLTLRMDNKSYIYSFPCDDSGSSVYKKIMENIPV